MELRTLRYFAGVLEAGSISRAASSLYVAQPALTAQIKKLEGELGVQLFERSHAGVTPTLAGLELYRDAQRLLSDADALRDRFRDSAKSPEGSVTLSLPFMLASLLTGSLLARLKQDYPRIRVFILDDLSPMVAQAMLDRRADIGIVIDTAAVEGLDSHPLARDCIYFCGRDHNGELARRLNAQARRSSDTGTNDGAPRTPLNIPFEVAAKLPLLLQSRRFAIRRRVDDASVAAGVPLNVAHQHDSTRTIRSLLLCGAGFTFAPACSLRASPVPDADWINARVVQPELSVTYYTLVTPVGKQPDAPTQIVQEAIFREARAMIEDGTWDATWLGTPSPAEELGSEPN